MSAATASEHEPAAGSRERATSGELALDQTSPRRDTASRSAWLLSAWVAFVGCGTLVVARPHLEPVLGLDPAIPYGALVLCASAASFAGVVLLRRAVAAGPVTEGFRRLLQSPLVAGVALSIALGLLAGVTYAAGRAFVVDTTRHRLEAVAKFEASVVTAWIEDARGDIRAWSQSPHFFRAMEDWRSGGPRDTLARQRLLDFLWLLSKTSHYAEVGVRDTVTGTLLLTTREDSDSPLERHEAVTAAAGGTALVETLRGGAGDSTMGARYLGYFAPVALPGTNDRLVMDVALDLEHELYPLVEPRPAGGGEGSPEVLLVRRLGRKSSVLNDAPARHPAGSAPALNDEGSIGSAVARGEIGFVRGTDDRGWPVLAYAQPVVDTQWILVADMNESEVFAELNKFALLLGAFAGTLLLLANWWWLELRRHRLVEQGYERERAAQARHMARLSRRVVSVQEEERRRLAGELHDRTGANLATINLNLRSLHSIVPDKRVERQALMDETRELIADTIVSIREVCSDLRPSILDHAGLLAAIDNCLMQFRRRTGVMVEVDYAGFSGRCSPETESVLFRIVQEAVLNCSKHAQASRLRLELSGNAQHLLLRLEDDGVGFDVGAVTPLTGPSGSGLLSMRERAQFLGGTLDIDSAPGKGTRISIRI
jgi:signal transduction histidine kinase